MRITKATRKLGDTRVKAGTVALLARALAPHLAKGAMESLHTQVGERVRRGRVSQRQRRIRRALKIGAYVAGAATAVAAARVVGRKAPPDPTPDLS